MKDILKGAAFGCLMLALLGVGAWWLIAGERDQPEADRPAYDRWTRVAHAALESRTTFDDPQGDGVNGTERLDLPPGDHTITIRDLDKRAENAEMKEGSSYTLTLACAGRAQFTVTGVSADEGSTVVPCRSGRKAAIVTFNDITGAKGDTGNGLQWDGRMHVAMVVPPGGVQGVLAWHAARNVPASGTAR
jgi:hypothetical protein